MINDKTLSDSYHYFLKWNQEPCSPLLSKLVLVLLSANILKWEQYSLEKHIARA